MEAIPCVVGDEEVWTSDIQYQLSVGRTRTGRAQPHLALRPPPGSSRGLPVRVIVPLPDFEFCGCLKLLESEGATHGPFLRHVQSKELGKGVGVAGGVFP